MTLDSAAVDDAVAEKQEDVVRRFLAEAVEGRQADTLDKIGADDDLREHVEAAREDGETLDDAVRRLLRLGVTSADNENPTSRYTAAGVVLLLGGVPAVLAAFGQTEVAYATVAALFLWVLLGGAVSAGIEYVRGRLGV